MDDDDVVVLGAEMGEGEESVEVLISALEHFSYCPRQCALIHLDQTFEENVYTIRGKLAHERVDSGDDRDNRGVETLRTLPLWSERYGLRGQGDVVEWHDGVPYPVEYKSGRKREIHAEVQLCAQGLCLEEMMGVAVLRGALYMIATKTRYEVEFDAVLRGRTLEVVAAIRVMLVSRVLPPAVYDGRCRGCSLIEACLPEVVVERERGRLRALQRALFET